MKEKLPGSIKQAAIALYPMVSAFFITAGWNWYHLARRPHLRFVLLSLLVWVVVCGAYYLGKRAFAYLARRLNRHLFWQTAFLSALDRLFLVFSLLFLVFFSRYEIVSLVYFSFILAILFWQWHKLMKHYPMPAPWLVMNLQLGRFGGLIFLISSLTQYFAYHYYILDADARFYNIVLFRSWSMTMFWLAGFAIAWLVYGYCRNWTRYILLVIWPVIFVLALIFWAVNIGSLYMTGLHLNPIVLDHIGGGGAVVLNWLTVVLAGLLLSTLAVFIWIYIASNRALRQLPSGYWPLYNYAIIGLATVSLLGLSSFKNTPEFTVVKSFYRYFSGQYEQVELNPATQKKLERFGLFYSPEEFYLGYKEKIFSTSTPLLPTRLLKNRPNIMIVFLESMSSRLTEVYNPRFTGLTPGLKAMAEHQDTTIFYKYYNASTPTVTGLLSQLCSLLPPTGHSEIQNDQKLRRLYLACLPRILKQYGGYKTVDYITAVSKDFANKGTIFKSIGFDTFYGTEELAEYISGEPLAWGYSDHQLFDFTWPHLQTLPSPFVSILSTVDTHPPFTLAKDMIAYGDGSNDVLNSVHTTDDAFKKFWSNFIASPLARNTILIAVADHAIFPTALTPDAFPDEAGKMTFYDENTFLMYIPDNILPKKVDRYASGIDFAPTLLQLLNINAPNAFDGHSIFDDRALYPNLLGMHELGLYINQVDSRGRRQISYDVPGRLQCDDTNPAVDPDEPLTLCEFFNYYQWKRRMFEEGRFWEKP